jgi:hypothetical protein
MKSLLNRRLISLYVCTILSFTLSFSQPADELKKLFEPRVGDWKLSEKFQAFNPENLYDYIDGGADNYLSYDFKDLLVATYEKTDNKYITVEIYNHKGLPQTFGIYSSEKPSDAMYEIIGAQGYVGTDMCNFFTGNYYVKISTHETTADIPVLLKKIASELANKLVAHAEYPKILAAFPATGKVENSEVYIHTNFLGYEILHSAYQVNYQKSDKIFKMFVIETKSEDEAKLMLEGYAKAIKASFSGSEGINEFKDPYNGVILMEWKGKYIWGLLNDQQVKIKEDYLKLMQENLFRK